MNKSNRARRQSKWLAGAVASLANVLLLAGMIGLANHYTQSGMDARTEAGSMARQTVTSANRNS